MYVLGVEESLQEAIDFVHSLNIGGRNALDGTVTEKQTGAIPTVEIQVKTRQCPVETCHINLDKYCTRGSCLCYDLYRAVTGLCETCSVPVYRHPVCQGCGIFCGEGHLNGLPSPYRGAKLCGTCKVKWKTLERVAGRVVTWQEFMNPQPKIIGK